jgi:serine/threonine protein kinase
MVVIDDANQMKNASPEILLETAQDVVTNLVHHSKLFNESSEIDNIPRFSRSDIVTGRILGRGGFCTVKEIKSIKAEEKMPSNSSSGQPKSRGFPFLRKSDTLDHSIRSSDGIGIPPKQFMAYRCSRGGTKYYVLKQVAEDLVYQDRITFLKGVVDLVLESQYLASLSHPNIVEIRGLSDQSPFSQGYFIVVDRLKETLPSKLKQWMTIDRQCKGITGVFAGGKKKQDGLLVDRMKAAYGVANALSYIHSLNVVYRDLVSHQSRLNAYEYT